MKIETVYKGTCVLLGICFITMIGYNVGVSKGEETDTSKDEIPDWWDLMKPKVEWIELEYWVHFEGNYDCHYMMNITNTLDYTIFILSGYYGRHYYGGRGYSPQGKYSPIWYLNTTEGSQYRAENVRVKTVNTYDEYVHALLPNNTITVDLEFSGDIYGTTQETIYYEAYIESENTIVKGVCEIPNITP